MSKRTTENPCLLNHYAGKLKEMFSPELIAWLPPVDRGHLRTELTEIIGELEKAGIE